MARTIWLLSLCVPALLLAAACDPDVDEPSCERTFHVDDRGRCVRWVEVQRVVAPASPGSLLQLDDGRVLSWWEREPMRVLTPDALRWDPIAPPPLPFIAAASKLPDGRVLAIGGPGDARLIAQWDPVADSWSEVTELDVLRIAAVAPQPDGALLMVGRDLTGGFASWRYHADQGALTEVGEPTGQELSLITLDDGRVMKLGTDEAYDLVIEIFDPATGTWSPAPSPVVHDADQVDLQATVLGDASVLLLAGDRTELYSPLVASWRTAGASIHGGGRSAGLTTLPDGTALAVGAGPGASTAIYAPQQDAWTETWPAPVPRDEPVSCWRLLTLPDGRVLARAGVRSAIYQQQPERDEPE